jgi:hypothetical protein
LSWCSVWIRRAEWIINRQVDLNMLVLHQNCSQS